MGLHKPALWTSLQHCRWGETKHSQQEDKQTNTRKTKRVPPTIRGARAPGKGRPRRCNTAHVQPINVFPKHTADIAKTSHSENCTAHFLSTPVMPKAPVSRCTLFVQFTTGRCSKMRNLHSRHFYFPLFQGLVRVPCSSKCASMPAISATVWCHKLRTCTHEELQNQGY